jgi:methyl-CpG-binding domain protein 4
MASRPENVVAAAAKVIRIIHDDHAVQSRYLHALKVTPGETHSETKSILQCMEQEEYQDVLTDLEPPQKAAFFDKVASTSEKSSEPSSTLDKETIKLYFDALDLKAKGLNFKDVCAEVKKRPIVTATAPPTSTTASAPPSTPLTSKPYREEKIEVKELNLKDKPIQEAVNPTLPVAQKAVAVPAPKPQKEKKENKNKQDKKRKREEEALEASKKPKTEPEAPVAGLTKRQRRREKQKLLLEKVAAGEVPAVSKPTTKEASETEKVLPVSPSSASKEQSSVVEDVQLKSSEPASMENSEPAPLESTVQANPKSKKVRRSRHRSEKGKSKPIETEQPIQPSALDPPTVETSKDAAPIESNKKSRRKARKTKATELPVTVPAPVAAPLPVQESSPVEGPAITEDVSPSSSDEDDLNENSPKKSTMSDFIRRTTLPLLGKPSISATADPSSDNEDEPDMANPSIDLTETIEPQAPADMVDTKSDPEVADEQPAIDAIRQESFIEAIREESPSPTTRETSVSSEEQVPSPPRQQEQKKSSPVAQRKELPKPAPSSFISAPAQPTSQRPRILNSFSKPQSSFTSTRSGSLPSATTKKSGSDAFAEFAAFAAGKKLGYDSSDDDDDSSSSSSSSDSDDEKSAPIPVRKLSPVRRRPSPARPISPIVQSEPEPEPEHESESEHESEPTAMDIDTEVAATQEQADPVVPAIDVVMTNGQNDTSSPVEYIDSQPSTQAEAEETAGDVKDDNSIAFQSFHESTVSHDAPAKTPLPDFPSAEDLMEFGGYQPSSTEKIDQVAVVATEDQEQTSEPANRENHEGPVLTEPTNSIEPAVDIEAEINDKSLEDQAEADEHASSLEDEQALETAKEEDIEDSNEANNEDPEVEEIARASESESESESESDSEEAAEDQQIPEVTEELNDSTNEAAKAEDLAPLSDPNSHAEEVDEQASASLEDEQIPDVPETFDEPEHNDAEDEEIPQLNISDSELEEPAEAFSNSMNDFLAAWEEETDNFENRILQLRQLLVEDGDGSAEDNVSILEKLMNEVDREEKIYKSKTTAARNGLAGLAQLARIKILEVLDRADSTFEERLLMVKGGLREEYNAESANTQLSPEVEDPDVEMKDESDPDVEELGGISNDDEVKSPAKSGSPPSSSLGWAPSEDEGLTESAKKEKKTKTRRSRKSTGTTSEHFTPSPKRKRVPAGTSAVPFPKLSAARFGLIQERLANDPFRLLIAVTFLNKTHGKAARPIFEQVMETYPTPQDLAAADVSELSEMIHSLGFQNQRARKLIKIAETWISEPPQKGKLHRTMDYPNKGNGRHLKPKEIVDEDVENCIEAGALEIAHIYGLGPYAWDSWRIFCRDVFRGVAQGYNGEGISGYAPLSETTHTSDFEPEWKRVVPLDKELRACLRWMWLREGWEWDPLTGEKHKAAPALMREASDGIATWDEPVAADPHGESTTTTAVKHELEGPKGPDALVPGVKAEDATPAPKRRTRRGRDSTGGGAAAAKRATTPPPAPAPKQAATPAVPASTKRLNADPEIMTSRLRPRAGRADAIASAAVPPTPSRRRAPRK